MAKETNDKSVPTLVDVIIPGKPNTHSHESDAPPTSEPIPDTRPPQSDLKKQIELQISKILVRHMEDIRKEVIRRVLKEVQTYLDSTKK